MRKYIFLLIITSLTGTTLRAQFNLAGEFRPRTEYSHGYGTLAGTDQSASLFTSQRTRLNLGYNTDKISTKLVLQDVRNWGNQRQLTTNEDFAVSIHEAWASVRLRSNFALQMGRQELAYDNHRILGNVGWAQQGRSHDLLLAKVEGKVTVHLGLAYNQSGERTNNYYFGPDAYKAMQFLWLNKSFKSLTISILALNNGIPYTVSTDDTGAMTEQGIHYSQTIGGQLSKKMGKLDITGNAYYQMGTDAAGRDLRAYEYMLDAGLKLTSSSGIYACYEYLSGTEAGSSVNNSFTPLYGTNHKFNGHMDYFYVGNHMNSVGLQDISLRIAQKFFGHTFNAHVHGFLSARDLSSGNYLGTELDLFIAKSIGENINIQIGYSQMFASEGMAEIKSGSIEETSNWAYLMFTFSPQYFKN
jgi:hypothetical protein